MKITAEQEYQKHVETWPLSRGYRIDKFGIKVIEYIMQNDLPQVIDTIWVDKKSAAAGYWLAIQMISKRRNDTGWKKINKLLDIVDPPNDTEERFKHCY